MFFQEHFMCISSVLPAVEVTSWGGFPRGASAGLPGPPARPVRPARGCTALLTCPCLCFGLPFGLSFCLCFCLVFLSLFLSQFLSLSTAQCICSYCNNSKLNLFWTASMFTNRAVFHTFCLLSFLSEDYLKRQEIEKIEEY